MKRQYQIIEIDVDKAKAVVDIDEATEVDLRKIKGIFATINKRVSSNCTLASTLRLVIDNQEVFPVNFDIDVICDSEITSWKNVRHEQEIEVKSSSITGKYIDGGNSNIYPYKVKLYLITG